MRSNRELTLAALAMLLIGGLYLGAVYTAGTPSASGLIGHSFGILGFVLMLATETLYSLRKRSTRARWGRMSSWMQFHIFTGIVGPFLVFLHTAWELQGLAGVVTLLTMVVVLSGFVGRYIYTAVPRTADGMMLEAGQMQETLARVEAALAAELQGGADLDAHQEAASPGGWMLVIGRWYFQAKERQRWSRMLVQAGYPPPRVREIHKLLARKVELERQVRSMQAARRLLAVWHGVHIPIGMALFAMAFVHIGAALYFATLQP